MNQVCSCISEAYFSRVFWVDYRPAHFLHRLTFFYTICIILVSCFFSFFLFNRAGSMPIVDCSQNPSFIIICAEANSKTLGYLRISQKCRAMKRKSNWRVTLLVVLACTREIENTIKYLVCCLFCGMIKWKIM